jgi:hypothetical protein
LHAYQYIYTNSIVECLIYGSIELILKIK